MFSIFFNFLNPAIETIGMNIKLLADFFNRVILFKNEFYCGIFKLFIEFSSCHGHFKYKNFEEVYQSIFWYIEAFYNSKRINQNLRYLIHLINLNQLLILFNPSILIFSRLIKSSLFVSFS